MDLFYFVFVLLLAEVITITVKPCPTNKIAPHRRSSRHNRQSRTFGHIYSLFADEDEGNNGALQEEPQADDPDDCGDIEDYDENDLSSVTGNGQRKLANERFFFGPLQHLFGSIHNSPSVESTKKPEKYTQPTRPPSGGYFGTNQYRPQAPLNPSDHLKPVHEYSQEPEMLYKPTLVGAPLGHVVGVGQVKPTRRTLQSREHHIHPTHPEQAPPSRPNHLKPRNVHDTGLFRSFLDLLL